MWPLAIVLILLLFLFASQWMGEWYRRAAGVALVGHVLVAVAVVPRVPYSWDIAKFHTAALAILAGQTPQYATTVTSFATFQSLVYTLTGPDPVALSLVNGLIAVLIPLPLRYALKQLYPGIASMRLPTIVLLFLPIPFVILTVPMRDALSTLLFVTILALFIQSLGEASPRKAIPAAPLWGILYLLRPELALIIVVGVGAAVAVHAIDTLLSGEPSLSVMTILTAPFGLFGFLLFTNRYPLGRLNREVTERAKGGAGYLEGFQYQSWGDVIVSAPLRAIYFQFAPFPLHVDQLFHLAAATQTPVLIVIAVAAIRSLSERETDRKTVVFLLTVYLTGVVGYGLIDSNFGTTIRHRVPFVFLLVVFAGPLLERWWSRLRVVSETAHEPRQT